MSSKKRDDKPNLLKGVSHEALIDQQLAKRIYWLEKQDRWNMAQITYLRYRRTIDIHILKSNNLRRFRIIEAEHSERIREMELESKERQMRYDDKLKEKRENEARFQAAIDALGQELTQKKRSRA